MDSKLVYFPVYARGEAIRMLCHHANLAFKDERVTFEEFGARKAAGEFPVGQVPVWCENGKMFNQSCAILRMLGQRHGYYAQEPERMWLIDSAVDTSMDFLSKLYPTQMSKEKQDDLTHKTYIDQVTAMTEWIHKTLQEHKGDWIAGEKISIGDFALASVIFSEVYNDSLTGGHHYRHPAKEIMEDKHNVKKYIERMEEALHKYLKHRPEAGF